MDHSEGGRSLAFADASTQFGLVILGEGPERRALEKQVADLGLTGRVLLPGYFTNPHPIVAKADFFISASRNEGFPNAIAEAMALERPVIATDCPSGPAELLEGEAKTSGHVVNAPRGLLVPDNDRIALTLAIEMMADPEVRRTLGKRGRERIDDFPLEEVVEAYWRKFDQIMATPHCFRDAKLCYH